MITSLSTQTTLFLQSCVLGVFFGICYDIFRAVRYEFRLRFIGIFICDTFFWCINLITFLIFILNFANGEGRLYIMFAIILGTIFYFLAVSYIILKLFRLCFRAFRKGLFTFCKLIKKIIKNFWKNPFIFQENIVQLK